MSKSSVFAAVLFFVATFFLAAGYAAVTPIFEGADEIAHYSSIKQVADLGTIPLAGKSFLAQTVLDYAQHAPMTYWAHLSRKKPEEKVSRYTYESFFREEGLVKTYDALYRSSGFDAPFIASDIQNWQAQHPPLYYILLAPVAKIFEGQSLWAQIFALRMASFAFVLGGMALALYGSVRYAIVGKKQSVGVFVALYPLMFPMFFPEFARMGNDSLSVLLLGGLWFLLLHWLQDEFKYRRVLALGVCCALGLLTKAFFWVFIGALVAFMAWRIWKERHDAVLLSRRKDVLLLFLLPVFYGSFWYFYKLAAFGSFLGDTDSIIYSQQGGHILSGLLAAKTYAYLPNAIFSFLISWFWCGSGSFGHPAYVLYLPLIVFSAALFSGALIKLRALTHTHPLWWCLWACVLFMLSLIAQGIKTIIMNDTFSVPGWYLHVLVSVLALLFAFGAEEMFKRGMARVLFFLLLTYSLVFFAVMTWMQMALYAGCATLGGERQYVFPDGAICLTRWSDVLDRMRLLGNPDLAALCYGIAFVCIAAGLAVFNRSRSR